MSASSKKKLRKEQNNAQLTEKQLQEQKAAKKLTRESIAFTILIVAMLLIGIGSLAYTAISNSGISERTTKALTVGDHSLNSAELNYFYIDTINETYQNWYQSFGEYTTSYVMMFYGLDLSKPMNEQMYDEEAGMTYADYFVDLAVDQAVAAYTIYDEAKAKGHTLSEDEQATIDDTIKNLAAAGASAGYQKDTDYLKACYGKGANLRSFRKYLEVITLASSYENSIYNGLSYTDSDIEAYNTEHFDEFSSFSYLSYYMTDDDFLKCPAKEFEKEDHEHSETELSDALTALRAGADALLDAMPTDEESFNAAIKTLEPFASDDTAVCEAHTDLLYSSITDEDLAAWLVDSARKPGDMTLIPNETESTNDDGTKTTTLNGYTVVVFQERTDNEMKLVNVRHILKSFTGGTTDASGSTVYSDAEKAAAEDFVTGLESNWVAGGATEEAFADLAKANSTDGGSAANGGLYENVYPGQMVPTFNDWCFDENRKEGDHGVIPSEYGYHLMYFVGNSDTTYRSFMIENTLRNNEYEAWRNGLIESAKHELLDSSKLALDLTLIR